MSKNILILSSSPRRGGNSDTLCDEFMRGAIESGNQVEKIFLRDKNIHPCTGCSVCSRYKKPCPQKDDAAEVIEKMLAAVISLGSMGKVAISHFSYFLSYSSGSARVTRCPSAQVTT